MVVVGSVHMLRSRSTSLMDQVVQYNRTLAAREGFVAVTCVSSSPHTL